MKNLILFLSLLNVLLAKSQEPVNLHFSLEEGLPSNTIYEILQSSDGLIYLGTDDGIVKFNGVKFKKLNTNPEQQGAYTYLYEDDQKRIWCLNLDGRIYYYDQDSIQQFTDLDALPKEKIIHIFVQGHQLAAISNYEYCLYDLKEKTIIRRETNFQFGLTRLSNLNEISAFSRHQTAHIKITADSTQTIHQSFLEDFQNDLTNIIACHWMGEPVFLNKRRGKIYDLDGQLLFKIKRADQTDSELTFLKNIGGEEWALTYNGLYNINKGITYFQNASISDLYLDKLGNYWISTLDNGLYVVPDFDHSVYYTENSILKNDHLTAISKGPGQSILLGTHDGYIYSFESQELSVFQEPFVFKEIRDIEYDSISGKTAISNNRLYMKEQNESTFTLAFSSPNITFLQNFIFDLGFKGGLLLVYDQTDQTKVPDFNMFGFEDMERNNFQFKSLTLPVLDIKNKPKAFLYQQDTLILCNQNNLLLFSQKQYKTIDEPCACTDIVGEKEVAWICSKDKGIFKYFKAQDSIATFTDASLSDIPFFKLKKDQEFVWAISKNTLFKFNKKSGTLEGRTNFKDVWLKDFIIYQKHIYLISSHGFYIFPKQQSKIQQYQVPISIQQVSAGTQQIEHQEELNYSQNDLKIEFEALDYSNFSNFQYAYRLNNLNDQWNTINAEIQEIQFPSLEAGSYIFELSTIDPFGNTNINKEQFAFTIYPPVYKTNWFIACCILFLSGLGWLVSKWRFKRYKKQQEMENLLNSSKLIALKSQMNPHFLFNVLNSIQELVLNEKRNKAYDYITEFSHLVRKYLDYSDKDFILLEDEIELLKTYMDLENLRLKGKLNYSVDTLLDPSVIYIPPMLLQAFVENSIKHGLRPAQKNMKININFSIQEGHLLCSIEDNGIGRIKSLQLQKASDKLYPSFSTQSIHQRFSIFEQEYKGVGYQYADHESGGTIVHIKIPYKHG